MAQDVIVYTLDGSGIPVPTSSTDPLPISAPALAETATLTTSEVTTSGSTTADVIFLAVENVGSNDGVIDGLTYGPGKGIAISLSTKKAPSITYDPTGSGGTTFRIMELI